MIIDNILWGGLVHKILMKTKLDVEPDSVILRKIIFFSAFTWLPLLILSTIQSTSYNPAIKVSLLTDLVVWARFFVALPILFYSERLIKYQIGDSLVHFINSGIISQNNYTNYEFLLKKIGKLRDSKAAELIILVLSFAAVLFYWRASDETNMVSTWLFNADKNLSLAGYWYYTVSAPVFQFFLYRMFWKFFLWAVFLYKISKMELNLIPINPDRSGGLNFLGIATFFFGFIGLAQGSVVSAQIAEFIIKNNVQLADFKNTIFINIIVLILLFILPMMFFITKLLNIRLKGILEYGILSQKYSDLFHDKWVKGNNSLNEQLLGSSDIQSLADLFNSLQIISKMRIVPFNMRQLVYLIVLIAIPFFPLIFFIISPLEILKYVAATFI